MKTIGEVVSRIKNSVKAVNSESILTDRYVFSLFMKHAAWLIRREDNSNKIFRITSLFTNKIFELEEVSRATGYEHLPINCIKRTRIKIPKVLEGYWGPMFKTISSIDGGLLVIQTHPSLYEKIIKQKTFKYNKSLYYWYDNGYLYFPNLSWEVVKVAGLFENNYDELLSKDSCASIQDSDLFVPEYLHGEIESQVLNEIFNKLKIPTDQAHDNVNINA